MRRSPWTLVIAIGMLAVGLAGCGTSNQIAKMDSTFNCPPGAKIEVGKVTNETGKTFEEIDLVQVYTNALTQKLLAQKLLCEEPSGERLVLDTKIVEYEPGNAFKRWLMPGYGSTVMAVNCDLKLPPDQKLVGSIEARRTVSAGGAYTIGAWETIVGQVADDVIKKLKEEVIK